MKWKLTHVNERGCYSIYEDTSKRFKIEHLYGIAQTNGMHYADLYDGLNYIGRSKGYFGTAGGAKAIKNAKSKAERIIRKENLNKALGQRAAQELINKTGG